jgi:exosortase E/protease (VPEID-CTERM system)
LGPLPLARWVGLSVLLFVEATLLAFALSAKPSQDTSEWLIFVSTHRYAFLRLGMVAVVATLFFGGQQLGRELQALSGHLQPATRAWTWLLCHLLAFVSFGLLLLQTLRGGFLLGPWVGANLLLGMVLGLVALASWGLASLPGRLWLRLLGNARGALLGGLGVGFAACLAGWLTDRLWLPLSQGTLWVVAHLLSVTGVETVCEPTQLLIGTPEFPIKILPACSGYQGIGLVWVFLGVYLWLFRQRLRFPQALLLLPVGTVVIWLANAARITLLILVGTWVSPDVASEGFHSHAGWLAFNLIALGIVAFSQRAGFLTQHPTTASEPHPAACYLVPFLAVVAAGLVTEALVANFDYLYPIRVLVAAVALLYFRRSYAGLGWSWSWSAGVAGATVFGLWVVLVLGNRAVPADDRMPTALAAMPAPGAAAWLAFRAVGYVVLVPLVEELAFRGYLTRRLIAADIRAVPLGQFSWFSFLVSSVCFGVLHGHWLAGTLAGAVYALVFYRRGRIGDAVLAHATTNGLLAGAALLTGQWSLWS